MRRPVLVVVSLAVLGPLASCAPGGTGTLAGTGPAPGGGTSSVGGVAGDSPTAGPATGPPPVRASYAGWRLPFPISREAVVADPARPGWFVLAGGMLPGDASSSRALELEPVTGRTEPLPSLRTPVHDTAGGLLGGRPAVFGGGNATEQSVVQAFAGGVWTQPLHLPTTRSDLSVVEVSGSTLVVGGYDGTATPRAVLRIGPDGKATRIGLLRQGVRYAGTAVVGTHAYVFGGEVDHRELDAVQEVDATTGRTRVVARLPFALGHAAAMTVGDRVLLLGGRTAPDTMTRAMWWFDPVTGSFSRAGRLPAATSDAAAVASGNRVWLLGGESPAVTGRVIVVRVS